MRELRKNIESLDSSNEELESMEEMKIEEVLMGLKGLKQEEVFSFLGKNNFTPAETEEWLKMMASAGFGTYDQITSSIDTSDMDHLQLNIDATLDNYQNLNNHIAQNLYNVKNNICISQKETKSKCKNESLESSFSSLKSYSSYHSVTRDLYNFTNMKVEKEDELCVKSKLKMKITLPSFESEYRQQVNWPKYSESAAFTLSNGHLENLKEEEVIASSVNKISSMTQGSSLKDDTESKYVLSNTYVIQSPQMDIVDTSDKQKPIKLLIKRVEGEDEVSNTLFNVNNTSCTIKGKPKRVQSSRRKSDELTSPSKRKRCVKKLPVKSKVNFLVDKKKKNSYEELDFTFANTVHQDEDFVYPSLDLSDDEVNDVYHFNQIDDETWTPKIKMKINEVKSDRPTRDRKRNNAIAKCLEAAALKRAESNESHVNMNETSMKRKCVRKNSKNRNRKTKIDSNNQIHMAGTTNVLDNPINGIICDDIISNQDNGYLFDDFSVSNTAQIDISDSIPSTSFCTLDIANELSILDCSSSSDSSSIKIARQSTKTKNKTTKNTNVQRRVSQAKLIAPKTCKLVQTIPGTLNSQHNQQKRVRNETAQICVDKKSPNSSYITKRGKPKKGMATAKQRLGKILKMHKMFF